MTTIKKINVNEVEISVSQQSGRADYICLTDMAHYKDKERTNYIIQNWMRLRSTIEFLGLWEQINNPNFNSIEFDAFKNRAGSNVFTLTPKQWIDKTGAVGIISTPGRYGGTYAHKDIAFEFGTWLSPSFKLYLIKEYQRLKEVESHPSLGEWNVRRLLSKTNYTIHTDAVQSFVIPQLNEKEKPYAYASEADLLNLALWGCTAKQWREANPKYSEQSLNIRDVASINELIVLSNLESFNAELLKHGMDKEARYHNLHKMAQDQLSHFNSIEADKKFRAVEMNDPKLIR